MFGNIGMPELMVILVIALIIFGHDKIPEMGDTIGKTIRGFKKAMDEAGEKQETPESGKSEGKKE